MTGFFTGKPESWGKLMYKDNMEEAGREGLCERESCHVSVPSSKRRVRLKWQLIIRLSWPDWKVRRRRRICRPLKSLSGSVAFCFLPSTNICLFLSFALHSFSLSAPTQGSKMTDIWIVLILQILIQLSWMQFFILCFNLIGWNSSPGSQRSWEAFIITSCLHHLLPKVFCLLLPHASTGALLTQKRKVDLILRNRRLPFTFLQ